MLSSRIVNQVIANSTELNRGNFDEICMYMSMGWRAMANGVLLKHSPRQQRNRRPIRPICVLPSDAMQRPMQARARNSVTESFHIGVC